MADPGGDFCVQLTQGPWISGKELYEVASGFNFPLDYHYITWFEANVIDLNSCLFNR
jgi:hypothetical protein